jgi:hypothetical protein
MAGRTGPGGPGVLGRVLRIGGLAAAAVVAVTAVLVSAGPAPAAAGGRGHVLADGVPWPCQVTGTCKPSPCTPSCSPVIVDVDGSGFRLTGAARGVWFDLPGTGRPVRIAWTAPGSTNAFLVLPRGGRVSDGRELFGNLTPQPASAHPNGFAALAVWDQPGHGGNGDGIIGPADAVWPRLRLWQDRDHDGKAGPGELRPLSAFGITGISLRYHAVGGADRFGNRYGYAAAVYGSGHAAPVAYDFFLATAPAAPQSRPGSSWASAAAAGAAAAALAGAALAARRRRPRSRARTRVTAGQAQPGRDLPVSAGQAQPGQAQPGQAQPGQAQPGRDLPVPAGR